MSPPRAGMRTRLVAARLRGEDASGALDTPIHSAVTFVPPGPGAVASYDYSRSGNPTRGALEERVAALEGARAAFAFASGMAAVASVLMLFRAGDHLLVTRDCNGGTVRLIDGVFGQLGLGASYVDTRDPQELERARRETTRAVLVENFSNPHLYVTDVAQVAAWARERNLLVIVDSTVLTPLLARPLEQGADIVVHSATKLLSGHGDVTAGLVAVGSEDLAHRVAFVQNAVGAVLSPHDSWLVLRGMKTLAVRLERAQATALKLATFLAGQAGVRRVFYPALPAHPGHELLSRVASGPGQIVSFELAPGLCDGFLARLRLVPQGPGFGTVTTIISRPAVHCHACLTDAQREERDIGGDLLRLSVGLEDVRDLRRDLGQALLAARRAAVRRLPPSPGAPMSGQGVRGGTR